MFRLTDDDSNPRVEDAAERHMRLCDQLPGGDKYKQLILPFFDEFLLKKQVKKAARSAVNTALDATRLADRFLDDVIRKVHGRSKEYDNEHLGSNTQVFLFPNGNITSLVAAPMAESPAKAHEVSVKLVSLGAEHTLYPLAAEIDAAVDRYNEKLVSQDEAAIADGNAKTALYIAKTALVKQYNDNFHLAAVDFDKEYAERLYPKLSASKPQADEPKP
ncbi:hypothetical protein [Sunxiuqinia dokdonensis]|uniref:Uncharacterized protein n=1 Tax=Sunxiuqinia dokdonensis TaxID=1409788 RepID=A0A0L8VDJ2_9BACT|nr:hypothetical protein [Sunxiuqinia dokdonensis]KOH46428.1 hypothetical protein NC99_07390 [Sunxiuqinia dokdonensis]